MTFLSFIIPVYKTPLGLLRNCLDSVLRYSQPMELVCVLDSPGDPCEQVLDEYAAKEPRMRLLKNDRNRGVSYSRNRGMDVARGEYLAFVDADDEIVSKTYERAFELSKDKELDGCVVSMTQSPGRHLGVDYGECCIGTIRDEKTASTLAAACYMAVYPMIFCRALLVENQIRFLEGRKFCEDFMVLTRILCASKRFAYLNLIGYKSKGHSGSTCRSAPTPERYLHLLLSLYDVLRDISEAKVSSTVQRWYVEIAIQVAFFDGRMRRCLVHERRTEYLSALRDFLGFLIMRFGSLFNPFPALIFRFCSTYPRTWFFAGMLPVQMLHFLFHYKLLMRKM